MGRGALQMCPPCFLSRTVHPSLESRGACLLQTEISQTRSSRSAIMAEHLVGDFMGREKRLSKHWKGTRPFL